MVEIYVDGDACPVKDEVLKVAVRNNIKVHIASNIWHRNLVHPLVNQVVVPEEPDAADDWIAEHVQPQDLVVTADILLAARCIEKDARVLGPNGKPLTKDSIGMAVAMRDLMSDLRDQGDVKQGGRSFSSQDRSRFSSALESAVNKSV